MYKLHSKYLNLILSSQEKKKFINFSILLIFGIFLEVFGLLILYPVIKVFVDPEFSIIQYLPDNFLLLRNLLDNKILLIILVTFIYIFKTLFQRHICLKIYIIIPLVIERTIETR